MTEERDAIEVAVTRIDDYLQAKGVSNVDFIKMDVQGAEFLAFKGMENTLSTNKNLQMLLEYSSGSLLAVGVQPSEFLKLIRSYGFRIFILRR